MLFTLVHGGQRYLVAKPTRETLVSYGFIVQRGIKMLDCGFVSGILTYNMIL